MSAPGADQAARLTGTMVEVLVAGMAEAGRLRRGRLYARQGAVADLRVAPGVVSGSIQGSRPQPYVATAKVPLAGSAPGGKLTALVPTRREIRFECTCPDDDAPCKHVVALMATFAERLSYDPSLFLRWRTGADELGSGEDAPAVESAPAGLAPEQRAALDEFLGVSMVALPPVPELPALPLPRAAWDEVWAEMLAAAIETLQRPAPLPRRR